MYVLCVTERLLRCLVVLDIADDLLVVRHHRPLLVLLNYPFPGLHLVVLDIVYHLHELHRHHPLLLLLSCHT